MFLKQETSDADKFSVTSILSSMANGQLLTPNAYSMVSFLTSGSGTGTTPTLTPTSLVSLEQTFTELQSASAAAAAASSSSFSSSSSGDTQALSRGGGGGAGSEPSTQSGFVPPVVIDSSSREQSQDSFDSASDSEWEPAPKRGSKRDYYGSGGSTSSLPVELDADGVPQRKYTRRSRHEKLSPEEERRRAIRRERNKLAAAKCRQRRVDHTNSLLEETHKLESEKTDLEKEIQTLQQQKDQLDFILQAHAPLCKVDSVARDFKIKTEPEDFSMVVSSSSSACPSHHHSSSSRPKSLALDSHGQLPAMVSCAGPGIPLSTPSSGLFTYTSLDSLVDGSTGLTPLTAGPTSCSSQVHRSESESGSDAVTSPTLISL